MSHKSHIICDNVTYYVRFMWDSVLFPSGLRLSWREFFDTDGRFHHHSMSIERQRPASRPQTDLHFAKLKLFVLPIPELMIQSARRREESSQLIAPHESECESWKRFFRHAMVDQASERALEAKGTRCRRIPSALL
jgi:hypothetical protein